MSDHSEEYVRKQIKTYMMVFGALAVLTLVTVAVSYLHLAVGLAVGVGLLIAMIKGGLVASFFMHLTTEKRWIYGVLLLTALFFAFLFILPLTTIHNTFGEPIHYGTGGPHVEEAGGNHSAASEAGDHGGGH